MASSTFPGHLLRIGRNEHAIQLAKRRLNKLRSTNPKAKQPKLNDGDGIFGQRTELRVEQFQRRHGLGVDGIIGPETWAALFSEPRFHPSERALPHVVVRHNVVCQSSRTSPIQLIVVHDTQGPNVEGVGDLVGLGNYFDRVATQASSHVATDEDGTSARYVPDERKAWHVVAFNSMALGIEQVGFAAQAKWLDAEVDETARWVAHWSHRWDIPMVRSTRHGVCTHSDLGAAGGGHTDPGPAYPFERMLSRARHFYALQEV